MATVPSVPRGKVFRTKRQMSDEDARAFLKSQRVAHVGVVDAEGWPYVIPLVFVYEGADILYLHNGAHEQSHFWNAVKANPRLCLEVDEIGPVHPGKRFACDSSLVYSSVVAFGRVSILEDRERKTWFFDRLLEKYGSPDFKFEPGYPALDRIVLYEMQLEIVTGKRSEGLYH
jgi:uncharacterized protein